MNKQRLPIFFALLAAALYGVSVPAGKFLLRELPPAFLAALLYLGAGLGMALVLRIRRERKGERKEARIEARDMPYVLGMIVLDIAAPIALLVGLSMTTPANASLLNNFEIAATSLIALLFFKEAVGRRMWLAIGLITIACVLLSLEDVGSLSFSFGSLLVLAACIFWGLENNCTRMLSLKDPLEIVVVKGLGSGTGALAIAIAAGMRQTPPSAVFIAAALLLGFFAYGLSIYFYILAQRALGAARTSAFYAVAPFIGAALSLIVFDQQLTAAFIITLLVMASGAYLAASEKHQHRHAHDAIEHDHRHSHSDGHHDHTHDDPVKEHSHPHRHGKKVHAHAHTPDLHHDHTHM